MSRSKREPSNDKLFPIKIFNILIFQIGNSNRIRKLPIYDLILIYLLKIEF